MDALFQLTAYDQLNLQILKKKQVELTLCISNLNLIHSVYKHSQPKQVELTLYISSLSPEYWTRSGERVYKNCCMIQASHEVRGSLMH